MGRSDCSSTSLAPGFRFHPTDEELVAYYLKKKVCGKSFRFDCISEIDIYKVEPWDLPGLSKLKTRDQEWYFFSGLDKKYGNGSRTNRATLEGYWKTTGKDRPVYHKGKTVGMKKTLVYHKGRAPRGERTNWVMHEYKLVDEALEKAGYLLEGLVLCRIFRKSGTGPKNGEQYGAPYEEQEWENENEEAIMPGEVSFEDPFTGENAFIEENDLYQNPDLQLPQNLPVPNSLYHEDRNVYVEGTGNVTVSEEKYFAVESEYKACLESEYIYGLEALDDQKFFNLPVQVENNAGVVRSAHMSQPDNITYEISCLPSEPPLITAGDASCSDALFLDAGVLLCGDTENSLNFGGLGPCMEDDVDIGEFFDFDSPSAQAHSGGDESSSMEEMVDNTTRQVPPFSQELSKPHDRGLASSSEQVLDICEVKEPKLDMQYSFLNHANRLLGSIPAPPAFASELPSKEMAARLSAVRSSSSIHVTAGMIRIRDMGIGGSRLQWSFDKSGNINVLLSFDILQDFSQPGFYTLSGMLSTKMAATFRGWLRSMLCVLFCAVSLKMVYCIYAK